MSRPDVRCRRVLRKSNPLWPILIVVALIWISSLIRIEDDTAIARDQRIERAKKLKAAREVEWLDLDKVGQYFTAFDRIKKDQKK